MSVKEMKLTVDGHECFVRPEILSIIVGIDGAEYRVFFKEEKGKQVVSKIVSEPKNPVKGNLLDRAIDKYWGMKNQEEKMQMPSYGELTNDQRIEFEEFVINQKKVSICSESIRLGKKYRIYIEGEKYDVFAEIIKDIDGDYGYKYGEVVYLDEVNPSLSSNESSEIEEVIRKAITQKLDNKDKFFEFRS